MCFKRLISFYRWIKDCQRLFFKARSLKKNIFLKYLKLRCKNSLSFANFRIFHRKVNNALVRALFLEVMILALIVMIKAKLLLLFLILYKNNRPGWNTPFYNQNSEKLLILKNIKWMKGGKAKTGIDDRNTKKNIFK